MKTKIKVVLTLLTLFFLLATAAVVASDPTGTSFTFEFETYLGYSQPIVTDLGQKPYGSSVEIDPGTSPEFDLTGYEFATYVVNNKVEPYLPEVHSFLVTEELFIEAFYKPDFSYMVVYMDANQDFIDLEYVPSDGLSDASPYYSYFELSLMLAPIPGYIISDTETWIGGSLTDITEDTVLYVNYIEDGTPSSHTVTVVNGTADDTSYNFNEVATVTASGTGNFQHWERNGEIVSINESYSFTVFENITVTAVYDTSSSPNPDELFINLIQHTGIQPGYATMLGQFNVPEDESLIEYGIISSPEYSGGITLDTPNIDKQIINKYNSSTYEFVGHFNDLVYGSSNFRSYMITTDGSNVTVTYSPMTFTTYTSDLFFSEYVESSTNKVLEIYNGTGSSIDLTDYEVKLYNDGSSTANQTLDLTGTLAHGEVYVIVNSGADQVFLDEGDSNSVVTGFDGNDAITLTKSDVVIDIIGEVGIDPIGGNWAAGTSGSTEDYTLVRNEAISIGNNVFTGSEWTEYPTNTSSYIGSHTFVPIYASSLTISGQLFIGLGLTIDLDVIYNPSSSVQNVYWSSSNAATATVDENGVVAGNVPGTVTITVYSYYDNSVFAAVEVTVLEASYTVTYDSNEGSAVSPEDVTGGESATEPTDPTKTDKVFDGWYTDVGLTNLYDFSDPVVTDLTLYAKWIDPAT